MLEKMKAAANRTQTENGAAAYASTGSACLDLFATIGALRRESDPEIVTRFLRAYTEDPDLAMKMLFFARDVRGGLGERRVFRVILRWLALHEPGTAEKNLPFVAAYGRYDDLLCLLDTPCRGAVLALVQDQLDRDLSALEKGEPVSLLAKWLPSVNASNRHTCRRAKQLARGLGLSDAAYRKTLSALRAHLQLMENYLRRRDYTFDYAKQPSRALWKYKAAFVRNDGARYRAFLSAVAAGRTVLHADQVAPYELVEPYLSEDWSDACFMRRLTRKEKQSLNATWAALPDFGSSENALAVVDTSGSMYFEDRPMPAAVALSLGLYFARHNTGVFHNHLIEFSQQPHFIELRGKTFADQLRYVASFCEIANTNLEAVFDLILDTAVENQVPRDQMPAKLIILSDMEFDQCVEGASAVLFETARQKFAAHGYALPRVVFWNLASRRRQQPVTQNAQGVALVSGVTPQLFSMVAGDLPSPYAVMMDILGSDRYAPIAA